MGSKGAAVAGSISILFVTVNAEYPVARLLFQGLALHLSDQLLYRRAEVALALNNSDDVCFLL